MPGAHSLMAAKHASLSRLGSFHEEFTVRGDSRGTIKIVNVQRGHGTGQPLHAVNKAKQDILAMFRVITPSTQLSDITFLIY